MTKGQKFKKEYAQELMLVAFSDLDAARTLKKAVTKLVLTEVNESKLRVEISQSGAICASVISELTTGA